MKKKKAARRKRKKLKQNKVVSLTANTSAGGQKQISNRKIEKKILLKMADFSTVIQLEFLREKSTRQKLFYISNYVVKSQNNFDIEKKDQNMGFVLPIPSSSSYLSYN